MFIGVILITSRTGAYEELRDTPPLATEEGVQHSLSIPILPTPWAAESYDGHSYTSSSLGRRYRAKNVASPPESTLGKLLDSVGTHRVRRLELDYLAEMACGSPERVSPARRI
jgi:hypothetical protein